MTVMIKETRNNLIFIRDIFLDFRNILGLEINAKNTKIIWIFDTLDDLEPTTKEVKFVYAKEFTLLGVKIDNKLKKI